MPREDKVVVQVQRVPYLRVDLIHSNAVASQLQQLEAMMPTGPLVALKHSCPVTEPRKDVIYPLAAVMHRELGIMCSPIANGRVNDNMFVESIELVG